MFFQDIIQNLNNFWSDEGCLIMQPYDTEKGAGTMNPHTFLGLLDQNLGPLHMPSHVEDLQMEDLGKIRTVLNIIFNIR